MPLITTDENRLLIGFERGGRAPESGCEVPERRGKHGFSPVLCPQDGGPGAPLLLPEPTGSPRCWGQTWQLWDLLLVIPQDSLAPTQPLMPPAELSPRLKSPCATARVPVPGGGPWIPVRHGAPMPRGCCCLSWGFAEEEEEWRKKP